MLEEFESELYDQPEWFERSDDYNVFEENQLALDRDAEIASDDEANAALETERRLTAIVATVELLFEGCEVPASNLVGGVEGRGFGQVLSGLEAGRINIAARAVAGRMHGASRRSEHGPVTAWTNAIASWRVP